MHNENIKTQTNAEYFTIAFYNLENLFDTIDDAYIGDNDFLPKSERRWTEKRYQKKIKKLGKTISQIGFETTNRPPCVFGVAEVENKKVVQDIIESKYLKSYAYDYVHYDSSDERGIDVAFIYDSSCFKVTHTETTSIIFTEEDGDLDFTRDILLVQGIFNGEDIAFIVNHWPSRREGEKETEFKRLKASNKVIEIINKIKEDNHGAKVIIMGDFNDNPNNKSIRNLTKQANLHNPMETIWSFTRGSMSYRLTWNLFDQILFSTNFFKSESGKHGFSKVNIFDKKFLQQYKGKYKGTPYRTYVGLKYKGGFSDHFPVYLQLKQHD